MFFVVALSTAFAQESNPVAEPQARYQATTLVDFGELRVGATLVGPSGAAVLEPRRALFNPLIRVRRDFDAELAASVDEVK